MKSQKQSKREITFSPEKTKMVVIIDPEMLDQVIRAGLLKFSIFSVDQLKRSEIKVYRSGSQKNHAMCAKVVVK